MPVTRHERERTVPGAWPAPARLLLIDDHAILRAGLRAILDIEIDLRVIAEAGTIEGGIALSKMLQPDVVIIDISFPGGSGLDAIAELRRDCEDVRIIVLTVHNSEECLESALKAGAHDLVAKDAAFGILLGAIRGTASRPERGASPIAKLTVRERQVLIGIAQGYSSKQIAERLCRSGKTIEKHRSTMMRKLSLRDATAVTRFAIANGFLSELAASNS